MVKILILFLAVTCSIFSARAQLICGDGTVIHEDNLCNGKIDCVDGFDEGEDVCSNLICPLGAFRCYNGGCINKEGRCNKTKECPDGSDENYCNFRNICKKEFQCLADNKCINESRICNGVKDCVDGSDETKTLCRSYPCPNYTFRCKYGGCIHQNLVCDGTKDCIDGSDEEDSFCEKSSSKIVSCKGIYSNRLETVCESDKSGHVPCNKSVPIGTIAKMSCKQYYLPTNNQNNNLEIRCQTNGEWSGNVLKCEADCGRIDHGVQPLIINGKNSAIWPWHAVMYLHEEGDWVASCGGTLISENVVLTAAHCVWKKSTRHMKFAFAKYHTDFNKTEDFTQIRNAKIIFTRPEYLDYRSNYGSDISVVILSAPVQFSEYIRPACLDWNLSNMLDHLSGNQLGSISGMGLTGNDKPSAALQSLQIPVVSSEYCIKKQKRDFKKYVTFTVFCAGWANGTSVCNGDSGGGLLFRDLKDNDRWILQGIVSISPRRSDSNFCDANRYSIFTKVGMYLDWLQDVVADIRS